MTPKTPKPQETEKKIDTAIRKLTHYEKLLAEKDAEIKELKEDAEEAMKFKIDADIKFSSLKQKLLVEVKSLQKFNMTVGVHNKWEWQKEIEKYLLAIENMFEREDEIENGNKETNNN